MDFKEAFELVLKIHEQNGDKRGWESLRLKLQDETKWYKTGAEFFGDLYRRSDLSQDDCWEFEEFDSSIDVLFTLMYRKEDSEQK